MKSKRRLLPLLTALLINANLNIASVLSSQECPPSSGSTDKLLLRALSPSKCSPSSESTEKLIPSSSKPGIVIINEASTRSKSDESRDTLRARDPPGSPVNLFMPDEFHFYTLNNDGQLVMKQMSKQEIQGMIAAGGNGGNGMSVDFGPHQTNLPIDGQAKVSDVVQNVQKVLKSELNKPVQVHHGGTSIPGSVNSEWATLLPIVLSGSSNSDANVIMPALDTDSSYADVVPIGKPIQTQFESDTNYVQAQPTTSEQEIKLITLKPSTMVNEKPIHLLGNMALPSGILGEQETYNLPVTSNKPNIETTNLHSKFTTSRPSLISILKDPINTLKNSSQLKPTLYIPLSVSPTLLADSQNQDYYYGDTDLHILPGKIPKPISQEKNTTKSPEKKPTTIYTYDSEFARVPMIQVPVIDPDKISTSTQQSNYQQTPMFEILPTISPLSPISTTVKQESHPSKINIGPIGGFMKPGINYRPTTSYRPVYEPVTKPSTDNLIPPFLFGPVYEPESKLDTINLGTPSSVHSIHESGSKLSTTDSVTSSSLHPIYKPESKLSTIGLVTPPPLHPVYEPITKLSTTEKFTSPTYRPVYQPVTKTNTINITSLTHRPVYEEENKPSTITIESLTSKQPLSDTKSTIASGGLKVTQLPNNVHEMYTTTGKSSTKETEVTKKPLIHSEESKISLKPGDKYQTFTTTPKTSTTVFKIPTKPSATISGLKVTKRPDHKHPDPGYVRPTLTTLDQKHPDYTHPDETHPDLKHSGHKHSGHKHPGHKHPGHAHSDHMNLGISRPDVEVDNTNSDHTHHEHKHPGHTHSEHMHPSLMAEKSSTKVIEEVTKPSVASSGLKVTSIENYKFTTEKPSPSPIEIKFTLNPPKTKLPSTKYPNSVSETTMKYAEKETPLVFVIHELNDGKYPEIQPALQNSENNNIDTTVEQETVTESIKDSHFTDSDIGYHTTIPINSEVESETPAIDYNISEKSTDLPTVQAQSEESSTESQYTPIEITTKQSDGTPFEVPGEISNLSYEKSSEEPSNVSEFKDQTLIETETTTPFVLLEESKTENGQIKYGSEETKTIEPNDTYTLPANEYVESTIGTSENLMQNANNDLKGSTFEYAETTKESNTPIYSTEKADNGITTSEKSEITMEYNTSENSDQTKVITENTDKPIIEYSTITQGIPLTDSEPINNWIKNTDVTPIYEKVETVDPLIKQNDSNEPYLSKTHIDIDQYNEPSEEDEISTVKVIPVYDDDTPMYTLPYSTSRTTYPATSTTNPLEKNEPEYSATGEEMSYETTKWPFWPSLTKIKQKPENQHYLTINQQSVPTNTITPSIPEYTSSSVSTEDTVLPGLEETFNNYMKEHYDPSLSTTGNYDDISHLTTFPTINKDSVNKLKLPNLPSTHLDHDQVTTTKYQTTINHNHENTEPSKIYFSDSKYNPEISSSKIEEKLDLWLHNKSKIETPIIHLDLVGSNSDKMNLSLSHSLHKDHLSNSSLTRIKIKNPVMDIDKIISEAQTQANIPSTERYTLPSHSVSPNNIASGIIAGYPTYSQGTPVTDYIPETMLSEIVTGTRKPNVSDSEEQEPNITQNKKGVGYQETQTTLLPDQDQENIDKSTSTSIYSTEDKETPTPDYLYSETPTGYESYTQIPFESLPVANKPENPSQTEENNDQSSFPPLDKINNLIYLLQNSHGQMGYDDYNSIPTTIVPMDKFETIINESNPTTSDETLSTIPDDLSRTSTESQNNTYVSLQTLPWKSSSKTYQTSTETIATTSNKSNLIETTTKINSKKEPTIGTTSITSTVKHPITEKPHVTSTYSTTKGFIDKIQSTIDKSAGRINLEEEKHKIPIKPTEPTKYVTKQKINYSTMRRSTTRKPMYKTTTTTTSTIEEPNTNENDKWTLIPQKGIADENIDNKKPLMSSKEEIQHTNPPVVSLEHASGAIGLDQSSKDLDKDVAEFLNMLNELSCKFWTYANAGLNPSRSVTMSPFGMISTLAMIFLGARGLTSIQMNDILKLDDTVTFNPHLVFQNITDGVTLARGQGIENAAFVRALFADRLKVRRILPFYKEQAQQFYEGAVMDINFSTAGDILRRRTNLLIRKQTGGRIKDFVKSYTVPLRSPLTALSANVFQTSCDGVDASSEGRDGEMYFAVSQTVKQRKLVPIPAVVWKSNVSAGYEPSLDATAVSLGDPKRPVSMIMVMPGQQGVTAHGDNLERLEHRLFGNPSDNNLEKLLKVIIPRPIEVQMPKFSHRSIVNVTSALKKMGFDQLFTKTADLKGINGAGHDFFLADMLQMNLLSTCGDDNKSGGGRHLSETYPGTSPRHMRTGENNVNNDYLGNKDKTSTESNSNNNNENDCEGWSENSSVLEEDTEDINNPDRIIRLRAKLQCRGLLWNTLGWRRRRAKENRETFQTKPRMKMDKPFIYIIRHNPTGLILNLGRFNPKNQS